MGIDLIGPLNVTRRGHRYIFVATEYLTRWAEASPIPDKSAATVAHEVMKLVYRFRVTSILMHDQGREFCNKLNSIITTELRIQNAISSAYHPQTNGLTERFNRTLVTQLMKNADEKSVDWDEFIDPILLGYRCGRQASTKFAPFTLMYGVQSNLAIKRDILIPPVNDVEAWDDPDAMGIEERMKAIHSKITAERLAGCENISTAQKKQKKMYDVKHLGPFYIVGVKVLLKNCRKDTWQGDKLATRWKGPYIVTE